MRTGSKPQYAFVTGACLVWLFCFSIFTVIACHAAEERENEKIVRDIGTSLLAKIKSADVKGNQSWPPDIIILSNSDCGNAFASQQEKRPRVAICRDFLLEILKLEESRDVLAFIIGHELAHIEFNHFTSVIPEDKETDFNKITLSRENEFAADAEGMRLALAAGYSYKKIVQGIYETFKSTDYPLLRSLMADHPSWKERLERLDKDRASLWRAYSAFENGVVLLSTEQYAAAESCFKKVVKEFPSSYEAYNNLGFAQLIQYVESFTPELMETRDMGEIILGTAYSRSETIESAVRGRGMERGIPDPDLWWAAVGSLREGLRINEKSALANANLAVAYLLAPDGKDVQHAAAFFKAALDAVENDPAMDPMSKIALFNNACVTNMSQGDFNSCGEMLEAANQEMEGLISKQGGRNSSFAFFPAIEHNQARILFHSDTPESRNSALSLIYNYLLSVNPASLWWPIGYNLYKSLCEKQNMKPRTSEELQSKNKSARAVFRPVSGVSLGSKGFLYISASMEDVFSLLGPPEVETSIIDNTALKRCDYPKYGISVIGTDIALALILYGPQAPTVTLRAQGNNTSAPYQIRAGEASKDEIYKAFGIYPDKEFFYNQESAYTYYGDVGLAFKIHKGTGLVEEIVVVQLPGTDMDF